VVEDPDAEMRHADLVGVGKEEADPGSDLRQIFVDCIDLGVDVPRGLGDEREKVFEHKIS
jgi:hypothetical protein